MEHSSEVTVSRRVADADVLFGRLTPRDRAGILREIKSRRKEILLANLMAAGIEKEQILVELEHFDDQPWGQRHWLDYLNTIEGQEHAVRASWGKCNSGDPVAVLDAIEVADGGLMPLTAEVCNLRITRMPPANAEAPRERTPD